MLHKGVVKICFIADYQIHEHSN